MSISTISTKSCGINVSLMLDIDMVIHFCSCFLLEEGEKSEDLKFNLLGVNWLVQEVLMLLYILHKGATPEVNPAAIPDSIS